MTFKKKLIEVSLPLPEVNDASAYDKMPGIGPQPKGLHQWWARLPLPTARAVLFASMVDDPSGHPEIWSTEKEQDAERKRLFDIIRQLMEKKVRERPKVYAEARSKMLEHASGEPPIVLDPFAGGGSIPIEALRLGFEARASDLNPVAVLINKAILEIAPAWVNSAPVHPGARKTGFENQSWDGTLGLAEDVRRYSGWMLERARGMLSRFYPTGPDQREVVAWLWCRTVASPDPALVGVHVPLLRSLRIAKRKNDAVWLQPIVDRARKTWRFAIGVEKPGLTATVGRRGGTCIISETPISLDYIRSEGRAGRLGLRCIALVTDGRNYRSAEGASVDADMPSVADVVTEAMPHNPFAVRPPLYGFVRFCDVFTPRQLHSLQVFSDLVMEARNRVFADARLHRGEEAGRYADAVATFLGFVVDRCVDFNNALCRWSSSNEKVMGTFGRQAIPMIWDFAEANILGESVGSWTTCSSYIADCIEVALATGQRNSGVAVHGDAREVVASGGPYLVSTDPPYYNNVDYSDLSDFFYVWLRRSIGSIYPELFSTVLTPKTKELVASPYRFDGDKSAARQHFEGGFRNVFSEIRLRLDDRFPMTVYYAFKQSDEDEGDEGNGEGVADDSTTTGWETLLEALIGSGFQITGTWPVRASQRWRQMSMGMNALASYIVLACRPRPDGAPQSSRREFIAELRRELPAALKLLQQGNVAPVDFAQAAIGPGMAVYSRYSRIIEISGEAMSVRVALGLINQIKDEVLGEAEADYDPYTRWAVAWYDQHGFEAGEFGDANTLANAHAVAVGALHDAGVVRSREGEVRLLKAEELEKDWESQEDSRRSIWRMTHQLVRLYFVDKRGDIEAAALLRRLGTVGDGARDLAYRLFSIAERRKRSQDAQGYNALVLGWPEIARLAQSPAALSGQVDLL